VTLELNEIQQQMEQGKLVFLDCSIDKVNKPLDKSLIELIPDSLFFPIEGVFSDASSNLPHTMVSAAVFTREVQKLGINSDTTIVLYDRWGLYSSPRAWWMFRYMGHKEVYVLNGGIIAWKEAGLPTVARHRQATRTGNFQAAVQSNWFESKSSLYQKLHNPNIRITDARGTGRFMGTTAEPRAGLRSGNIPGSTNLPFEEVLDGPYLKSKAALKEIFSAHIRAETHNIFTCGSGVTAAILALAAYHTGIRDLAVYDGSWAEWGKEY